MGVTSNAILCYGIPLKDESGSEIEGELECLGDEQDFGQFLAKLEGIEKPSVPYPGNEKEWNAYSDKWNDLETESKLRLVRHCHGDNEMWIIAIKTSVTIAHRGYPQKIEPEMNSPNWWRKALLEFCEKAGWIFEEPEWYLCSYADF